MDQEDEQKETKLTSLILSDVFLNVFEADDPEMLENEVAEAQQQYQDTMNKWEKTLSIKRRGTIWTDKVG